LKIFLEQPFEELVVDEPLALDEPLTLDGPLAAEERPPAVAEHKIEVTGEVKAFAAYASAESLPEPNE
jgi:hypothetical protein